MSGSALAEHHEPVGDLPRSPAPDPAQCLARTRYVDSDSEAIRTLAFVLSRNATPREAAIRTFEQVRDGIRYAFADWSVSASTTLRQGFGTCSNKNVLFVALLRAQGIPATCGVLSVNALEYFGSLAPGYLKPLVTSSATYSKHVYAAAYLDDRWVRCDCSTDRELAERTSHFCPQTRLVEWDGAGDSMDFIEPEHVWEDVGLVADLDELLERPARNATPEVRAALNDYLAYIRSQPAFASAAALTEAYRRVLAAEGR